MHTLIYDVNNSVSLFHCSTYVPRKHTIATDVPFACELKILYSQGRRGPEHDAITLTSRILSTPPTPFAFHLIHHSEVVFGLVSATKPAPLSLESDPVVGTVRCTMKQGALCMWRAAPVGPAMGGGEGVGAVLTCEQGMAVMDYRSSVKGETL